jgi:hypothetical protein
MTPTKTKSLSNLINFLLETFWLGQTFFTFYRPSFNLLCFTVTKNDQKLKLTICQRPRDLEKSAIFLDGIIERFEIDYVSVVLLRVG